jgi:hypothetical protein
MGVVNDIDPADLERGLRDSKLDGRHRESMEKLASVRHFPI